MVLGRGGAGAPEVMEGQLGSGIIAEKQAWHLSQALREGYSGKNQGWGVQVNYELSP
jgi:hypothetical protein